MLKAPTRVNGRRNWCGPYALAVLMGGTYMEALDVAKATLPLGRRRRVQGMTRTHVRAALAYASIFAPLEWTRTRGSLASMTETLKPKRFYIVNVTGHFVVVNTHEWTVIDNQTGAWMPLATSKHRRCRVKYVIEATPRPAAFAAIDTPATYYLAA